MGEDSSTRQSRSRSQGRREARAFDEVGVRHQSRSRSRGRPASPGRVTCVSEGETSLGSQESIINSLFFDNENNDNDDVASPEQQNATGNEDDRCSESDSTEESPADRFEELMERVGSFFNHNLPAAASQEALQAIRSVSFDGALAAAVKQDAQCVICCCDFTLDETLEQLPRCEHLFHSECLRRWLGRTSSCPICRHVLRGIGEGLNPGSFVRVYGSGGNQHLNSYTGACVRRDVNSSCWFVRLSSSQDEQKVKVEDLEVIQRLSVGAVVSIVGLVNAAHLNGLRGECMKWHPQVSRWQVRVDSGEHKSIRPDNLNVEELGLPDAINHVANIARGNPSAMREMMELSIESLNQPGTQEQIGEVLEQMRRNPGMQRFMEQFSDLNGGLDVSQMASLMSQQELPSVQMMSQILNSPLSQQIFQQAASALAA